jgi:hypothetical protein
MALKRYTSVRYGRLLVPEKAKENPHILPGKISLTILAIYVI